MRELKFYFAICVESCSLQLCVIKMDSITNVFVSWKLAANKQINRTWSSLLKDLSIWTFPLQFFLTKLQTWRSVILFSERLHHSCFPVNIVTFLKTAFCMERALLNRATFRDQLRVAIISLPPATTTHDQSLACGQNLWPPTTSHNFATVTYGHPQPTIILTPPLTLRALLKTELFQSYFSMTLHRLIKHAFWFVNQSTNFFGSNQWEVSLGLSCS